MFNSIQVQLIIAYIKVYVYIFPRDFILYTLTILHPSEKGKTLRLNVTRERFDINNHVKIMRDEAKCYSESSIGQLLSLKTIINACQPES